MGDEPETASAGHLPHVRVGRLLFGHRLVETQREEVMAVLG